MTHSTFDDPDDALARAAFVASGQLPPLPPMPPPEPVPVAVAAASEPAAEPESDPETGQEVLPEFDPRHRQPFEGLLYLGHLTHSVTFLGHRFLLVTPSTNERLEMLLLIREYEGSFGFEFAYSVGLVASYLVEIDGTPLPQPITTDAKDTAMINRWKWVRDNLHKPVIDRLFEEALVLDATVREVLDAMGKASG